MKRKNKYIERGGRVRKRETEIGLLAGCEKTMSKILKGRHSRVPNKRVGLNKREDQKII